MRTATLPSLRVEPDLRDAAERVLRRGETLSSFLEEAIRQGIERRTEQEAFVARGLASAAASRKTGTWVAAATVLTKLEKRLSRAKRQRRR